MPNDDNDSCTGVIPGTFIACGEGGNYCVMCTDKLPALKSWRKLMAKAELFIRRVSLRHDNPPKWSEEAKALADELHEMLDVE